ncbi:creatininase family protein [Desulfobaculum bizertense]|uniref:Creatinine amidohydrolase n=1 Tax=Desulfobaculum bizertense DSM 18034 TaxID=1121442 RepID=A0A1T4VQ79_9BACT|nr:creatininase family protein [Desulfobaculum bizertense]UIJ38285.1 creatininase family protein [Desulfobaculum bizertense]SKA67143.1 creatinine amidohydrolase [Desulfobaculum bizertense DSM 18034]
MPGKSSPWWQHKSWKEVVEHAKKCDIAILPLGSIEQHGPHLPTGHDTMQLFDMCERIAEETDAILLPCPWYGAHPHHHWNFPGTVPLSNDTCKAMIKDIVRGAAVAGYKKFIIFFGHGQAFVTNYTVQDLGQEGYYVLSVMFQNAIRDIHDEIFSTPFWHADEAETSIALSLFPEYVDMDLAVVENGKSLLDRSFVTSPTEMTSSKPLRFDEGTVSGPEYRHAVHGVIGDPTAATAEKGERYIQAIVDRMVALINQVKKEHPVGEDVVTN